MQNQRSFLNKPRTIFVPPEAAGRRIAFGFSYLQRVGRGASTNMWFSNSVQEDMEEQIRNQEKSLLDKFKVEWAAVRQFELLQEAGNLAIYDLSVENMARSLKYLTKMRAGGHRVTVITMGDYVSPSSYDELRIMDSRLQEAITNFINMLYLEEQSAAATSGNAALCEAGQWNYVEALPHVAITLGAGQLFKPSKSSKATERFFQLLEMLPQKNIHHEVAIGLQIPEATATKSCVYVGPGEKHFTAFQNAITDVFSGFDGISLGELHEREGAGKEIKSSMAHMRSYGDHMRSDHDEHYRALASFARSHVNASSLSVA
ncbi:MAG: hypothetical protein PHX43_08145 [Alphaproteobacteria bacterium]|nr:hypothetical protein [Alphaproteobacteria bacterium]